MALASGSMARRIVETRALRQELQQFGKRQGARQGEITVILRRKDQADIRTTYKLAQ
jgi:hypothetical protein